jgi:hypothetical protein
MFCLEMRGVRRKGEEGRGAGVWEERWLKRCIHI